MSEKWRDRGALGKDEGKRIRDKSRGRDRRNDVIVFRARGGGMTFVGQRDCFRSIRSKSLL